MSIHSSLPSPLKRVFQNVNAHSLAVLLSIFLYSFVPIFPFYLGSLNSFYITCNTGGSFAGPGGFLMNRHRKGSIYRYGMPTAEKLVKLIQ